mmetsp:Transcript_72895/g.190166  ORF Transcript_72895/g.190166 Transcript_72895/m.190166 type:complete len:230 (+) Transcript_72895:142-831(+)
MSRRLAQPNSCRRVQLSEKSVKKASWSAAYVSTHLLKPGSWIRAMSLSNMMVFEAAHLYCGLPLLVVSGLNVFSSRALKYELSNLFGSVVHAPSKPDRPRLHLPTACAPESATMSLSWKPLGWKICRKWSAPLSPSGRRPSWDGTDSAEDLASTRPKRVTMSGPPIRRMDTLAARAHKSAFEMRAGQYLPEMFERRGIATSGSPALALNLLSPPSEKRIAALGQPEGFL